MAHLAFSCPSTIVSSSCGRGTRPTQAPSLYSPPPKEVVQAPACSWGRWDTRLQGPDKADQPRFWSQGSPSPSRAPLGGFVFPQKPSSLSGMY